MLGPLSLALQPFMLCSPDPVVQSSSPKFRLDGHLRVFHATLLFSLSLGPFHGRLGRSRRIPLLFRPWSPLFQRIHVQVFQLPAVFALQLLLLVFLKAFTEFCQRFRCFPRQPRGPTFCLSQYVLAASVVRVQSLLREGKSRSKRFQRPCFLQ